MSRPQQYTDIPQGFKVYADVPQGFRVVAEGAPPPEAPPTQPSFLGPQPPDPYRELGPSALFKKSAQELDQRALEAAKSGAGAIPGMVKSLAGVAGEILSEEGLPSGFPKTRQMLGDVWEGVKSLEPIKAPLRWARGVSTMNVPEATQGAVDTMTQTLPAVYGGAKAAQGVKKFVEQRPVRLGRTTPDPATGKPIPPIAKPKARIGELTEDMPEELVRPAYDPSIKEAARAFGADKATDAGDALMERVNLAMPDIDEAQRTGKYTRRSGPLQAPFKDFSDVRDTVRLARQNVWKAVKPALEGEMDVKRIMPKFFDKLDPIIKRYYPESYQDIQKRFGDVFEANGKMDVSEIHALAAQIREQLDLTKDNAFKAAHELANIKTSIMDTFEDALRTELYDHMERVMGQDVRPLMQRYGALSELEQAALKAPPPESFIERVLGRYTFPTKRAVAARLGETLAQAQMTDVKMLNRAIAAYRRLDDVEKGTPTRPLPKRAPILAGSQQDLIPHDLPDQQPLFAPPPGFSKDIGQAIFGVQQRAAREARAAPPPTIAGKQGRIAEHALPPEDFHLGATGRSVRELDPVTGEPVVRDYSNQQQLFSLPAPRAEPATRFGKQLMDKGSIGTRGAAMLANITPEAPPKVPWKPSAPIEDPVSRNLMESGLIGTRGRNIIESQAKWPSRPRIGDIVLREGRRYTWNGKTWEPALAKGAASKPTTQPPSTPPRGDKP